MIIPYSVSRRVLESEEIGLTLTAKEYYNTVRYQVIQRNDNKTIEGLLVALDEAGFIWRLRTEPVVDEEDVVIGRKLIQIWFTHPILLKAAGRYTSGLVYIINMTFNTNKLRLPIIQAVGVLPTDRTFPIFFSWSPKEDHWCYSFCWESYREHQQHVAPVEVCISDQAPAILSALSEQMPLTTHQICAWHAVEAMCVAFRKMKHTDDQIQGRETDEEGNVVTGLKALA